MGTYPALHRFICRVDDISSEELRGKAEHCRTLAKAVTDEATRKTLRQMAEELERQADSLDAASPQLRPPPSMA